MVQSLGHCGACHTPRGPAFEELGYAEHSPLYLKGAVADVWESANLSCSLGSGLGRWSEADIVAFLKTGHGGGAIAFGSMKEAIERSTQYMTDGDLHAVAVYLKSFPEKKDETAYAPGRASITNEAALAARTCRNCQVRGCMIQPAPAAINRMVRDKCRGFRLWRAILS